MQAGFPPMDDCLEEAEEHGGRSGDIIQCVMYYMLSTSPHAGLDRGIRHVKGEWGQTPSQGPHMSEVSGDTCHHRDHTCQR